MMGVGDEDLLSIGIAGKKVYDTVSEDLTSEALSQLRHVFLHFAKSNPKSLSYTEFAKIYKITNGEYLPKESFGLIVGSQSSELSFEVFCSLYLQVYKDEGLLEGDRVFYADLKRLKETISPAKKTPVPSHQKENCNKDAVGRRKTDKGSTPATCIQPVSTGRAIGSKSKEVKGTNKKIEL